MSCGPSAIVIIDSYSSHFAHIIHLEQILNYLIVNPMMETIKETLKKIRNFENILKTLSAP